MIMAINVLFDYLFFFNLYQDHRYMHRALNTPQLNFVGSVHDLHEQYLFCFAKQKKESYACFTSSQNLNSHPSKKSAKKATSSKGSPLSKESLLIYFN
jgi:hypothetical protein